MAIGAGYFGAWVWHKTAGLTYAADDLGEWLKFFPVVRAGQSGIIRELFYSPIWITAMGLGLFAGRVRSIGWKITLIGLSGLLVLTPLPKYPELLTAYQSSEFAPTFWITVAAMLSALVGAMFGRRLAHRMEATAWLVLGVAAAFIAPLHFVKVIPEIARLYHFAIGWGLFAVVIGGIGLAAVGVRMLIEKKRPRRFLQSTP